MSRRCITLVLVAALVITVLAAVAQPRADARVTVIFTGDTLGLVEPCGCQKGMLGGLPRRATIIAKLRKEEPKLLLLDAGDVLGPTSERYSARLFGQAYRQMGYNVVALGKKDQQYPATLGKELRQGKIIPLTGHRRTAILVASGIRIGVLRLHQLPKPASAMQAATIRRDIADLRRQSDVVVILSDQGRTQDESLVKQGIAAEVLIGNQQWRTLKAPLQIGSTTILPTTWRGEAVGRVDLIWDGSRWQTSFRRYDLDEKVSDEPKMACQLQAYYDEIAQRLIANKAYRTAEIGYGVASACSLCHGSIYRRWQKTKHAKALRVLQKKHRERVPECLDCHSEYYRRTKAAPQSVATQGVECASCHGDGIILILRPSQAGKAARPNADVCRKCHTTEKSPTFDFAAYKKRIKHW